MHREDILAYALYHPSKFTARQVQPSLSLLMTYKQKKTQSMIHLAAILDRNSFINQLILMKFFTSVKNRLWQLFVYLTILEMCIVSLKKWKTQTNRKHKRLLFYYIIHLAAILNSKNPKNRFVRLFSHMLSTIIPSFSPICPAISESISDKLTEKHKI